jgi:4-hydroxy-2-oxoheptanedioate aldolase
MGSIMQPHEAVTTLGMKAYAGPSLFQPHHARQAIRDAYDKKIPPLIGYYAGLSSIPITRFLAPMGYDMVWIDWEHTSCDVETMTTVSLCRFPTWGAMLTVTDGP